jgi:hypothetical protein
MSSTERTKQHTPGPWRARQVVDQMDDPGSTLAVVAWRGLGPSPWMVFADTMPGAPEADARLMAAAPQMLDALERLQWGADPGGWSKCPVCANGESSGHTDTCWLGVVLRMAQGVPDEEGTKHGPI